MIDTVFRAAPAGVDGPGRPRVRVLPWASPLALGAGVPGAAAHTGMRPSDACTTDMDTTESNTTDPNTTDTQTTLGNHPPGRPQS